jgi:hypothetical protein
MLEPGTPLSVVATIMGWSPSTAVRMARRYGHIGQAAQREAVKALNGAGPEADGAQNSARSQAALVPARVNRLERLAPRAALEPATLRLTGEPIKANLLILRHAWHRKSTLRYIQNSQVVPNWYSTWARCLDSYRRHAQTAVPPTGFRNCPEIVGATNTDNNLS